MLVLCLHKVFSGHCFLVLITRRLKCALCKSNAVLEEPVLPATLFIKFSSGVLSYKMFFYLMTLFQQVAYKEDFAKYILKDVTWSSDELSYRLLEKQVGGGFTRTQE